ncbi:DUF2975 domain-containing protein [Lysinibacillus xylanilyticus]|uniref:DUF2975 domain-containing protein n=1 Tax=Lysinibacillus xylanilyticus TaxID=582475 RepID=UPI002B24920B|nr:DUF2975 domain-containing protein [Lysinibacillus xylanilyticus]MEB2302190.1 DUF2975 domain-containing protein [Lysinibacillus xylanilyticus]
MEVGMYRFFKMLNIFILLGVIISFFTILGLTAFYFTDVSNYGLDFKIKIGGSELVGNQLNFSFGIWLTLIIYILLGLCLLFFARIFVKNLLNNQIFVENNFKAIRYTSYTLAAMSIFNNIPQNLMISKIIDKQKILSEYISSSFSINYGLLIAAVTVFIFSFIFKEGIKIAEENKFTV